MSKEQLRSWPVSRFCPAAAATGDHASIAAACPPTLANQLADTGSATQLVTVVTQRRASTTGALRTWAKTGECWTPSAGRGPPVGQRGISERKHEGDRTTPSGAFRFNPVMYGIAANPGVRYRYHRVVCGDWWVEDPGSPSTTSSATCAAGHASVPVTSEDMSESPTAYRHLAVIDYNRDPIVPGRGSGIFLHVEHRPADARVREPAAPAAAHDPALAAARARSR